jgi:hypothetical protein
VYWTKWKDDGVECIVIFYDTSPHRWGRVGIAFGAGEAGAVLVADDCVDSPGCLKTLRDFRAVKSIDQLKALPVYEDITAMMLSMPFGGPEDEEKYRKRYGFCKFILLS